MKRKYALIVIIGIVLIGLAAYVSSSFSEKIKPTLYTFTHFVLDSSSNSSFQLGMVDTGFSLEAFDNDSFHIYYQEQLAGTLSLELNQINQTEDFYYFLKYEPVLNLEQPLVLRASIDSTHKEVNYRYLHYPNYEQKIAEGTITTDTPPDLQDGVLHDSVHLTKGVELPEHSLYIDGHDFSMHLNRVNIYEALGNGVRRAKDELSPPFVYHYAKMQAEPIQQQADAEQHVSSETMIHSLEITLPHLASHEIEQWGLIGQANMFAWEDEEQRQLYVVANLDRVRKWTLGGFQYITPTTYYPTDPNGFWVVPAQHVGNRLLLSGKDRFSRNIALLSLEAALTTQTKEGMWITEPRSEWLYEDYGIEAGFYDTRFSTDAGLFLIYGYRQFGEPSYLERARKYADYLVEFARTHHFETENGGYLVWDYRDGLWDGKTKKETHVSLNHLITEMNFLYELYMELNNSSAKDMAEEDKHLEAYLITAERMRTAVQDTRDEWKKVENGDLWYAYLPDGSYGLLDYPLLTLKDLRYSQELIEELYGEKDPAFQYLIELKEEYLRGQGLPLYD